MEKEELDAGIPLIPCSVPLQSMKKSPKDPPFIEEMTPQLRSPVSNNYFFRNIPNSPQTVIVPNSAVLQQYQNESAEQESSEVVNHRRLNNNNSNSSDTVVPYSQINNYGRPTNFSNFFTGVLDGMNRSRIETGSNNINPSRVIPVATTSSSGVPTTCTICGDRATGKHYGAHSCDGCKGFFRRSVRKNHNYSCRFARDCTVNKDKRNQCRYCRFKKCVNAGMKKAAVQNERDRITQRRLSYDEMAPLSNGLSLNMLVTAENLTRHLHPTATSLNIASMKIAELPNVVHSMKQQLIILVEWANGISPFNGPFHHDDRISILRASASKHLVLGVAWRSLSLTDVLLLGNSCIIPRDCSGTTTDADIGRIGIQIMDELVKLYQEINLDETEYACIKALVFFDPSIKGLKDINKIKAIRYNTQLLLEEYINDRPIESKGRFGQILLSLVVLQSISEKLKEKIHLAELFGDAKIDSFIADMLLGGSCRSPSPPGSGDENLSKFDLVTPEIPASTGALCNNISTNMDIKYPMVQHNGVYKKELQDSTYNFP